MAEKRAWLTDPETGEKFHAWSHVKSIFYNKATNILLKDKLDEMDKLIDEKIKKAMMSNIQLNDQNKVPTSALAYNMQQLINKNADDITKLNSDLDNNKIKSLKFTATSNSGGGFLINGAVENDRWIAVVSTTGDHMYLLLGNGYILIVKNVSNVITPQPTTETSGILYYI